MKLEESGLSTATVRSDEGAASAIAIPDEPAHGRRNVARPGDRLTAGPWPRARGDLLPLQIGQQEIERPIQDHRQVPGRQSVPHQILHAAEFVAGLAPDSELQLVTLRCERLHDRPWHRSGLHPRGRGNNGLMPGACRDQCRFLDA